MALVLMVVSMVSVLEGAGVAAARERWRRPLPGGAVAGSFSFDRAAPYERGRRRGIDVRGRPGAPVLAVCGGVVTHAGPVPRWGRGVTLRCGGGLVATELGLASLALARGARVVPGAQIGRLGAGGVLRLGARIAERRQGYVDPAALLRDDDGSPRWPAVAPTPGGAKARGRRRPPHAPAARRATTASSAAGLVAAGAPAPAAGSRSLPLLAGLALLATAAAGTGAARRRRPRQAPPELLAAQR
jgi:hypothetical protein